MYDKLTHAKISEKFMLVPYYISIFLFFWHILIVPFRWSIMPPRSVMPRLPLLDMKLKKKEDKDKKEYWLWEKKSRDEGGIGIWDMRANMKGTRDIKGPMSSPGSPSHK